MSEGSKDTSLSRRGFLKLIGTAGLLALTPKSVRTFIDGVPPVFSELEKNRPLTPRVDISLTGNYKINPENYPEVFQKERESILIPLHLGYLLPRFQNKINLGQSQESSLYDIYADGELKTAVEEAKKGTDVTLVMEMPTDSKIDLQTWDEYVSWLSPQIKASRIVIGNEMHNTELTNSEGGWDKYAQLFAIAYDKLKTDHPNIEIVLTAPQYWGRGEILDNQIKAIKRLNEERVKKWINPIKVDCVALHFYNEPHLLPEFIEEQQKVLKTNNWILPIRLTEMGVSENEREEDREYTEPLQESHHFKLTAVSAALIDQGKLLSANLYNALSPTEPWFHSTFENEESPRPAYSSFELARRLFHHGVKYYLTGTIITVYGHDQNGNTTSTSWNFGNEKEILRPPYPNNYILDNGLVPVRKLPNFPLEPSDSLGRSGSLIISSEEKII